MGLTVPPAETAWLLSRVVGFSALDQADIAAILEESTSLAEGVLAPLDRAGDTIGAKWNAGRVTLPDGFDAAFRAYAEAGWIGIAAEEEFGGQGLPEVMALAAFEPVSSANMGFGLCPLLTQDAIKVLTVHGTPDQQARLLRPMIEGRCTGTMCLTEPQSGSDLSGVRTRAVLGTRQSVAGRGGTVAEHADTLMSPTFARGFLELALNGFRAAARVPRRCCMQLLGEGGNLLLPRAGRLREA